MCVCFLVYRRKILISAFPMHTISRFSEMNKNICCGISLMLLYRLNANYSLVATFRIENTRPPLPCLKNDVSYSNSHPIPVRTCYSDLNNPRMHNSETVSLKQFLCQEKGIFLRFAVFFAETISNTHTHQKKKKFRQRYTFLRVFQLY